MFTVQEQLFNPSSACKITLVPVPMSWSLSDQNKHAVAHCVLAPRCGLHNCRLLEHRERVVYEHT